MIFKTGDNVWYHDELAVVVAAVPQEEPEDFGRYIVEQNGKFYSTTSEYLTLLAKHSDSV